MQWFNAKHGQNDTGGKTAGFTHARTRENIKSGEKHSTIFGKIARYFEDLKLVAFTGSYDDLNGKPSSFPPSSHEHTKSQITDFGHTHGKADITDFPSSLPASDVKAWAKAAVKPSYSWSEITEKPSEITYNRIYVHEINTDCLKSKLMDSISNLYHTPYIKGTTNGFTFGYNTGNVNQPSTDYNVLQIDTIYNGTTRILQALYPLIEGFYLGKHDHPFDRVITNKIYTNNILASDTDVNISISGPYMSINYGTSARFECRDLAYSPSGNYGPTFAPSLSFSGKAKLGDSSRKWGDIYCTNSTISTSDKSQKTNICYLGEYSDYDTYIDDNTIYQFVMGLKPVVYNRVDADSRRPHHGFIAQDVKSLLNKLGITDHAAFIKSPKYINVEYEEEETYVDETDGQTKTRTVTKTKPELVPGEYVYGLRYEEFIADIVRFVQLQDEKIQEQDRKIKSLEERLSLLENMSKASLN